MDLFNLSEIGSELIFQKRPSSKIKSPYVSDAIDKNGNSFLVHTPGLGLGGQYGLGDTITVTRSNPTSKTDYAMQCAHVKEDGYSKVTDQACREIRFGRISRKQAERIVSYYQMQQPEYIDLFCKWLNVDERSLYLAINRHRNEKFWTQKEPDKWSFKKKFSNKAKPTIQKLNYPNTIKHTKKEYITIGKGVNWPKSSSEKSIDWIDT